MKQNTRLIDMSDKDYVCHISLRCKEKESSEGNEDLSEVPESLAELRF